MIRVLREIFCATIIFLTAPIWLVWVVMTGALYGLAYLMMTFGNIVCKWMTNLEGPMK